MTVTHHYGLTKPLQLIVQLLVSLFLSRSPDSFREDSPNVVLSFNNKQQSFTMTLIESVNINNTTFHLKLLNGEDHILEEVTNNETMNLFVVGINYNKCICSA